MELYYRMITCTNDISITVYENTIFTQYRIARLFNISLRSISEMKVTVIYDNLTIKRSYYLGNCDFSK